MVQIDSYDSRDWRFLLLWGQRWAFSVTFEFGTRLTVPVGARQRQAQCFESGIAEGEVPGNQLVDENRRLAHADSSVVRRLSHHVVEFVREQAPECPPVQECRVAFRAQ